MSIPEKNAAGGFVEDSDPSSYNNPEKKASCKRNIKQEKPHSSKQTSAEEPCIEPQSEVVVVSSSGKKELTTFDKALELEVPSQNRIESISSPSALEKDSKVLCGSDEMPTSSKFDAKSSETDVFGKVDPLSTPENNATSIVKKDMNKQSLPPKMEKDKAAYTYPSFGMIWSPLQSSFCLRNAATQSDGKNSIDFSSCFQVVNEKYERDIWRYLCFTAIGFACAVCTLAVFIPSFGIHLIEVIQHLFYGLPKPETVMQLFQKFLSDLYEMLRK